MEIRFEICTLIQLKALRNIAKTTFIDAFQAHNNPDDFETYISSAFSEKQMQRELENPHSIFYLAYQHDDLVGYFKINEKDAQNESFSKSSIELERVYVVKVYQNRQIGKQLLLKAVDIAKSKKVDFVWLGVWEKNLAALRFYERYGFEKFKTHPYYIGSDKQTDWILKLELS